MAASSEGGTPRPSTAIPGHRLSELGAGPPLGADVRVSGITASSEDVRPGDLFAAVPGSRTHGAAYATDAFIAGAVAVLTDPDGLESVPLGMPVLVVPDVRKALGPVSARVYGNSARRMLTLGVTGTSGKTTTTFLMRAGLRAAGMKVGLIGTVATMIGDESLEAGFTTPEAPDLQALLAVMHERGVEVVVMEVSSHAVAMRRTDGVDFDVGGFTNLSEDHLDFHRDMDDYFRVKMRFVNSATESVVVIDDEWGRRAGAAHNAVSLSTDGSHADVRATDVRERLDGTTSFRLLGRWGAQELGCSIPGRYNVANVALAWSMLERHGAPGPDATAAMAAAQVPGRMERVDAGQPFLAVVDYSHKPAAVDGALRALRPLTEGKLIIVLGCGGDRDRGKRPHMGELATRGADLLVVTDDNPRSEDAAAIRRSMLEGALAVPSAERGEIVEVGDRAEAIAAAVAAARPGDTVLIAGKGHEAGQEIAGVKHPFDDRVVLREVLSR